MSILKREENMAKLGVTFPLKQMIVYEQCMKVGVMLNPTLNRRPQEGQGMCGCGGKDHMMNTG
jgi:hypothetical protein